MRDPVTITLSESVVVMDKQVTSLTIRPPRGKDLIATGNPIQMTGTRGAPGQPDQMTVGTNENAMADLLSRLANVPRTTIEDLSAADYTVASMTVMAFLAPTAAT